MPLNPYTIILSFFIFSSVIATMWGLVIIVKSRKSLQWPSVSGTVEQSKPTSEADDLLPYIQYSYAVSGKVYQHAIKFPKGMTPTPEFTRSYLEKYPVGEDVKVYYDPEHSEIATLEPGPIKGDWLVFAIGVSSTILGFVFLFSGS